MQKTIHSQQSEVLRKELRSLREQAGLTMRQLAERIGREHNFIGRIELGERRLDLVEAYWLFKALGVPPDETALRIMRLLGELDEGSSGSASLG